MSPKRKRRGSRTTRFTLGLKQPSRNPEKRAKHRKAFALYVRGREVYEKQEVDALEAALQPLVGGKLIERLSRHDTNPAQNRSCWSNTARDSCCERGAMRRRCR